MSGMARHHAEWLSLVETSGPFLMLPALDRALPQGLPKVDATKVARLRAAYEEWAESQEGRHQDAAALHSTWIRLVLGEVLEFDDQSLRSGDRRPPGLEVSLAEHHEMIRPDIVVVEPPGRAKVGIPRLLISTLSFGQDLDSAVSDARWAASPLERMTHLCRSTGIRLGLVTNGERWTLVDAPVGQTAGYASWYSSLWLQEPLTLAAFEALLGVRRFFASAETDTLEALLDESVAYQHEVTDQLGLQVRRAVEVLVQALDRADLDRQRELLRDVTPDRLYEASLTVMMRLVFLFCAEERGLLLLGDEVYDSNYAVSTLRAQLREEADRVGVEVLERRQDAWARLLASFRAVFGGIEHEALRMPALGGSLFDPDRFPFLEGRAAATSWLDTPASPLPIDNRTVLHLLEALQLLRMRGDGGTTEARKLSYRALDIEQIGHVYEGLLDHVAVRVDVDMIGLVGTKDQDPELSLDDLDRERRRGTEPLVEFLKEHTGRSASGLRNDVEAEPDEETEQGLLVACGNDKSVLKRVLPYHSLIRKDVWGYPQIYRAGSFMVTGGAERRQTGTHYTPKSLTEKIVAETLEPVVYVGPAEGKAREEWQLRSPAELLDLKICDMAMGSAAFLVQVCRWLGERIVESWDEAELGGKAISADGKVLEKAAHHDLLSEDREERIGLARRLIAERCIYGIDINPMAVELAKLSLWLVTLSKGRPFGFLDHSLRCGDSLLGIHRLDQLTQLRVQPTADGFVALRNFESVEGAVKHAMEIRRQLRETPIRDINDVKAMAHLDTEARRILKAPERVADAFLGEVLENGVDTGALKASLQSLAIEAQRYLAGDADAGCALTKRARRAFSIDLPDHKPVRRPIHWPLEFPEVFNRENGGFDAMVGNPPFMGGRLIGRRLGNSYQAYLKIVRNHVVGSPDLCVYFFLRAFSLIHHGAYIGLLATKSIAETGSRVVCLDQIIANDGTVYRAHSRFPWPGYAAVVVAIIWVAKGRWKGARVLDDKAVSSINAALEEDFSIKQPKKLKALKGKYSQGQDVMGRGFELTAEERAEILAEDPECEEVIFPLFNGQDLNTMPELRPYRWVIYFRDWEKERARHYGAAFRRVERLVKPYRESLTGQIHQDCFWKFWDLRPKLMRETASHESLLASAIVTKYVSFRHVPTSNVYNTKTKLYFFYKWSEFSVLQSSLHQEWAFWLCGTLGASTLNYSTSAALETWPMPEVARNEELDRLGKQYHAVRERALLSQQIGLTDVYNRFHSADDRDPTIAKLRELHREIDRAVGRAYGWDDLELGHGFHEVAYLPENDRVRFTISGPARIEVMRRLAELNHVRYGEQIREHPPGADESAVIDLQAERHRRGARTGLSMPETVEPYSQSSLTFDEVMPKAAESHAPYDVESRPARTIREWLAVNRGWHGKEDILAGTRVGAGEWPLAIKALLERNAIVKQGERRGSKYKAK